MTIRKSSSNKNDGQIYLITAHTGSHVGWFLLDYINAKMITVHDWEHVFTAHDMIYDHRKYFLTEENMYVFLKKKYPNSYFAKVLCKTEKDWDELVERLYTSN